MIGKLMTVALGALCLIAFHPALGAEQSAATPGTAASGDSLEERIRRLEKKMEELQRELAAARVGGSLPAESLAEIERRIELLAREVETLRIGEAALERPLESRHGLGPAASKVYGKNRGVSIAGYGEALYENFESTRDDGAPATEEDTADLLRVVLYVGYKWTDRILFNSEVEFEHASTEGGGSVSVEFANLEFLLDEAASVRSGLVLVPMGFVNELHEPPIFLGVRRPAVETVIIPTTWREVGAGVFGEVGPFSYRGYLVAGLDAAEFTAEEGIRGGRQQGAESKARDLALTGRIDWTVAGGLLIGASFFAGDSGQGLLDSASREIEAATKLVEGHFEWRWRGAQVRGLVARTSIGDTGRLNDALGFTAAESIGQRQNGWYGEAGYDVMTSTSRSSQSLIPFVRYEAYDTQSRVPRGFDRDGANDVRIATAGLSWKPIPSIAVKADYQNYDNRARTGTDRVNLGIGFIF